MFGHLLFSKKENKNTRLIVLQLDVLPMVEQVLKDFQKKFPIELPNIPEAKIMKNNGADVVVFKLSFRASQ